MSVAKLERAEPFNIQQLSIDGVRAITIREELIDRKLAFS